MNRLSSEVLPPCISPSRAGAIIKELTVPVTGCTEPAAIALATALAALAVRGRIPKWLRRREAGVNKEETSHDVAAGIGHGAGQADGSGAEAGENAPLRDDGGRAASSLEVEYVSVRTVRSLYKNALAVGIPNSDGGSGIYLAAALGPYLSPDAGLNLLKDCGPVALDKAKELMRDQRLSLEVYSDKAERLFVEARVIGVEDGERHVGEAVIASGHDTVTMVRRDGGVLYKREDDGKTQSSVLEIGRLTGCEIDGLLAVAKNLTQDVRDHIWDGIQMNRKAAEVGLERALGMGVGAAIKALIDEGVLKDDLESRAGMMTAAATDARMSGHEINVMSSSGSGNQGIMTTVPLFVISDYLKLPRSKLVEAVAVAHLVTAVMTNHTGLLSPLCGCVIKAGMGAAAGIAVAMGLDDRGVLYSLQNMAGNMTGEICDGAKVGCAVKLGAAARAAVLSALLASRGVAIPPNNGILASTGRELFRNIGDLAGSMDDVDKTIVSIMERKEYRSRY